ncbi:hypothetical protein BASA50_009663 [Batrachochytrium salamandrivorans]|uniref:F-box domain-containing protein n=1 Tax=Batrachochytrium salamandrivorans TaxID=1357716 RepID=A0ABQ8F3I6_9FUNG|nr:hypothetical protein BASA61_008806 [Batrachochytrium salamandrivorans]KAH6589961.1 hypothetical protein BASA50_009663 [Batrachochytrium salamandrivorans]KAH9246928.1 hypothetical protein BASA81_015506 [Batrachochytrium salamandrivorans]KAH9270257.1 hypothetical protein BASA83_007595 [Batrachochytrium salamandrivorans]KAJ1336473.1 hypothetical protein BSLG_007257 [Batrachochytrium salamandrivorans]
MPSLSTDTISQCTNSNPSLDVVVPADRMSLTSSSNSVWQDQGKRPHISSYDVPSEANSTESSKENSSDTLTTESWRDEGYGSWEEPSPMIERTSFDPDASTHATRDQCILYPRTFHTTMLPISPLPRTDKSLNIPDKLIAALQPLPYRFSHSSNGACTIGRRNPSLFAIHGESSRKQTIIEDGNESENKYVGLSLMLKAYPEQNVPFTYPPEWPSGGYSISDNSSSEISSVIKSVDFPKIPNSSIRKYSIFLPELLCLVHKFTRVISPCPRSAQRTILSACLVNKHWYECSMSMLWEHPYLASENTVLKFANSCNSSPHPFIPEINHIHTGSSTRDSFSDLSLRKNGSLVRKLDLGRVRLHDPTHSSIFAILAAQCTSVRAVRIWCESLDIFTLQRLATCSPFLDTLIISGNLGPWIDVCDSSLVNFVHVLSTLRVLQVDVGFDGDSGRNRLSRLISANVGPSMRHFRLAGADDDERVMDICGRCPNLEVLLYGWGNITDRAIIHISTLVHNLRVLDLRGCQKAVVPHAMQLLFSRCRHLESIDLSFTSGGDEVLISLIQYSHTLRTIILAGYSCSESVLLHLIERMGVSLRVFSIAWFGGKFTDSALAALVSSCPLIEKLDIRGCRHVSVEAIQSLVDKCKRLTVLKLEGPGSWDVTDPIPSITADADRAVLATSFASSPTLAISSSTLTPSNHRRTIHRFRPITAIGQERRTLLKTIRSKFPSDELVRLEESII